MLIYDIQSFPSGLTIDAWLSLYDKGIVIYDSHIGESPITNNDTRLSLIDINSISSEDLAFLSEVVNDILKEDNDRNKENLKIFRDNNQKLITYLKSINDEER
jgi:hypothetical protein